MSMGLVVPNKQKYGLECTLLRGNHSHTTGCKNGKCSEENVRTLTWCPTAKEQIKQTEMAKGVKA